METLRIGPGVPARRARSLRGRAVRAATSAAGTAAWGLLFGLGAGAGITIWAMLATAIS